MAAPAPLTDYEQAFSKLADKIVEAALDRLASDVPEGLVGMVEKAERGSRLVTMKQFCPQPGDKPQKILGTIAEVIADCDRFVEEFLGPEYFGTFTAVAVPCMEHGTSCRKMKAYLAWGWGASSGESHKLNDNPNVKFSALLPDMVDALVEHTSILANAIAVQVETIRATNEGIPAWAEKVSHLLAKQVRGQHEEAMMLLAEIHDEYGANVIPKVLMAMAGTTALATGAKIDDTVSFVFYNIDNLEINSVDEVSPPFAWAGRFLHAVARDDIDQINALIGSVENDHQWSLNAQALVIVCGTTLKLVVAEMYRDSD